MPANQRMNPRFNHPSRHNYAPRFSHTSTPRATHQFSTPLLYFLYACLHRHCISCPALLPRRALSLKPPVPPNPPPCFSPQSPCLQPTARQGRHRGNTTCVADRLENRSCWEKAVRSAGQVGGTKELRAKKEASGAGGIWWGCAHCPWLCMQRAGRAAYASCVAGLVHVQRMACEESKKARQSRKNAFRHGGTHGK